MTIAKSVAPVKLFAVHVEEILITKRFPAIINVSSGTICSGQRLIYIDVPVMKRDVLIIAFLGPVPRRHRQLCPLSQLRSLFMTAIL